MKKSPKVSRHKTTVCPSQWYLHFPLIPTISWLDGYKHDVGVIMLPLPNLCGVERVAGYSGSELWFEA